MKRVIVVFLVCILIFGLLSFVTNGANNLSFIAVNDTIPLTLSGNEAPFYSGGTLYVPYTVFQSISLDVSYASGDDILNLFNRTSRLVFDLNNHTVTDENKLTQSISAIAKNGTIFLPAVFCAAHFGVETSYLISQNGYPVVRFTTGSQIYENSLFIETAENFIAKQVAQAQKPPPIIPPDVVLPPTTTDPEEPTEAESATIYLAITGDENFDVNMVTLSRYQQTATFFLTAEEISRNPEDLRKLTAAGHRIGIAIYDEADAQKQIDAANDALDLATKTKTILVSVSGVADITELSAHYRIFPMPANEQSPIVAAQNYDESTVIFVESQNLISAMTIFQQENSLFLPLRETSLLP